VWPLLFSKTSQHRTYSNPAPSKGLASLSFSAPGKCARSLKASSPAIYK
jgi:hypothetical protein